MHIIYLSGRSAVKEFWVESKADGISAAAVSFVVVIVAFTGVSLDAPAGAEMSTLPFC
jgi:hypothetical protein